ncbi:MAG: hypothetical protein V4510_11210 [bacterium]
MDLPRRFWRLAVWAIVLFAVSAAIEALSSGFHATYDLEGCHDLATGQTGRGTLAQCEDTQLAITWTDAFAVLLRVPAIAIAVLAALVVALPALRRSRETPDAETWAEA